MSDMKVCIDKTNLINSASLLEGIEISTDELISTAEQLSSIENSHDGIELNTDALNENIDNIKTALKNINTLASNLTEAVNAYDGSEEDIIEALSKIDSSIREKLTGLDKKDIYTKEETLRENIVIYDSNGSANGEAQEELYTILSDLGYSRAAICAIFANIESESNFSTTALGDGGTSYGLCQWHNSRWANLNNYCRANGYDPSSVEGQARFLNYELETNYTSVYNTLKSVEDNEEGARIASKDWTINFEIPDNKYQRAEQRATNVSKYWQRSA